MGFNIHPQARTTPRTREEIRQSEEPVRALAAQFNLNVATVRKWKSRDDTQDRSHRPHTLQTTLSPAQEIIVVALRTTLLLPLDDLLVITRQFINANVSRSGLDRCLRRHGVSRLADLIPTDEAEKQAPKTFKDYAPGFVHIDIKYLPQMPDETSRRYLFVAIDRATRWVFMHIYNDQTEVSSTDFLRRLQKAAPMKIIKILTDNGTQFTDRFTSKNKVPSGQHAFDRVCATMNIEHRLITPRKPQTNGMVERFNGRIAEVVGQTRFESAKQLEDTLMNYLQAYNHHIPQKNIDHQTPIQALKIWRKKCPQLFVKNVYELPGLDTLRLLGQRACRICSMQPMIFGLLRQINRYQRKKFRR